MRNWTPVSAVTLNPERESVINLQLAQHDFQPLAASMRRQLPERVIRVSYAWRGAARQKQARAALCNDGSNRCKARPYAALCCCIAGCSVVFSLHHGRGV